MQGSTCQKLFFSKTFETETKYLVCLTLAMLLFARFVYIYETKHLAIERVKGSCYVKWYIYIYLHQREQFQGFEANLFEYIMLRKCTSKNIQVKLIYQQIFLALCFHKSQWGNPGVDRCQEMATLPVGYIPQQWVTGFHYVCAVLQDG